MHLTTSSEHLANMLDLFLQERLVNLGSLIDDPKLSLPPTSETMDNLLTHLQKASDTFIDIGYFDSSGVQQSYSGPFHILERKNYSQEDWYKNLKNGTKNYIITDIYLGFRQRPHFTLAVSRILKGEYVVIRATLDPEKFYEYITSLESSGEVLVSIVNRTGLYQLVTPNISAPLTPSSIVPTHIANFGVEKAKINGRTINYGYSWLKMSDWAVIVRWSNTYNEGFFSGKQFRITLLSMGLILMIFVVIWFRVKTIVSFQRERDTTRLQLEHAAKLASVGELAAGIAHEINNPLAIISEKAGLMEDMLNPEFAMQLSQEELKTNLEIIQKAVFRGRDITRKLLSFVRKTEVNLQKLQVNRMMDEIIDGFWEREMAVSNIEIIKEYGGDSPEIVSDQNQLNQVIINILNNAVDAITPPGKIYIGTKKVDRTIHIAVKDTGKGITPEQMEKIFLPFYTTKGVGRGTGLGLSVSYGIIKNLGGKILVSSEVGKGSVFTIVLSI
jgi:two-component system NtrC family sensor kinase